MSQKDYTSAKHSSECRWTGSVGNGQWNDPTNWSESILPGSADVVRFSGAIGDCEICIEDTITVGRIEMKTDSTDDRVVLTGGGTLILNGVDRLLGKPTTLQVMKGTLDFRNPLCVQVEGPRFSVNAPGGHLGIYTPQVYATEPDLKLAMSQTGTLTFSVPYWEPNMDWDIATSKTLGLGDRILSYSLEDEQPQGLTFNKFKEHDGDILLVKGFKHGDYLRFKEDPSLSTDPGKHLRLEGIRFEGWPESGAADIGESDGFWYFKPKGSELPDCTVHRAEQRQAKQRIPELQFPGVTLSEVGEHILAPATAEFPRNMGGDLVRLTDGRLLLAYSQWLGATTDGDPSRVVGMISEDDGRNWGEIFPIAEPDDRRNTVRMPSLVRLGDGRLALFVRCHHTPTEKSIAMMECRDESLPALDGSAWTEPQRITPAGPGGHIIIAQRVVRTGSGRLIVPLATPWPWDRTDGKTDKIRTWFLLSDDGGENWRQSQSMLEGPGRGLMEPCVVELSSARLMMLMRTQMHRQYISYSDDNGETWTKAMEVTRLISPESPAALAIEPNTGWIMVVWNRNSNLGSHGKNRTPLTVGFSHDGGKSWFGFHNLEDEPGKAWSYPSIRFIDGAAHVLYYEQTKTELGENRIALKMRIFRVEGAS